MVRAVVARTSSYRSLPELLADGLDDEASELHASCLQLQDISERLLARTREAHAICADVTGADVFGLVNAAAWTRDQTSA